MLTGVFDTLDNKAFGMAFITAYTGLAPITMLG